MTPQERQSTGQAERAARALSRAGAASLRPRLAAVCVAALMLAGTLLGGTGALDHDTDAMWTDSKGADGVFTALQIGTVQNYRCTAGLWAAATVSWQRPAGTPSGDITYRVTVQRGTTTLTTTQGATTYEYSRPFLNFDDVTITVQPLIGQWSGTPQSMLLDAVPLVGMTCP